MSGFAPRSSLPLRLSLPVLGARDICGQLIAGVAPRASNDLCRFEHSGIEVRVYADRDIIEALPAEKLVCANALVSIGIRRYDSRIFRARNDGQQCSH